MLARCKITVGKANERYENKILDRNEGSFCAALKPACRVEIEHSIYLDCLELLANSTKEVIILRWQTTDEGGLHRTENRQSGWT